MDKKEQLIDLLSKLSMDDIHKVVEINKNKRKLVLDGKYEEVASLRDAEIRIYHIYDIFWRPHLDYSDTLIMSRELKLNNILNG